MTSILVTIAQKLQAFAWLAGICLTPARRDWMEKDFQREEKEIREVQPVPVDAQADLGAATGMGCTEIENGRWNIFLWDVQRRGSGVA